MSRSFFAIVNGAAGGGRCRTRADKVIPKLKDSGVELEVVLTKYPGHATTLAQDAYTDGHRSFLSIGGDGTAFEIVNGLFANGRPRDVQLAMLPLGTGNSFLRDFGITDERKAMDAIVRGEPRPVDVIRVEHEDGTMHYINTLGIGFVAHAGALTNEKFKPLGTAGYIAAVMTAVVQLRYPVDAIQLSPHGDVDRRPAALLSFSNSQYTGGAMHIAPQAKADDGCLDVIRVGALPRIEFVRTFPKIFQGRHVEHPLIEQTQAPQVTFVEPRKQDVLIDGEFHRLKLQSLKVLPGAIGVLA